MKNYQTFQLLQSHIEQVSGMRPDFQELIAEQNGDEERALKIYAHSYIQMCRLHGQRPKEIKGIEQVVREQNNDYDEAQKYL